MIASPPQKSLRSGLAGRSGLACALLIAPDDHIRNVHCGTGRRAIQLLHRQFNRHPQLLHKGQVPTVCDALFTAVSRHPVRHIDQ